MKVVLIYPGVILTPSADEKEYKDVPTTNLPLGILYLGQVLKENGHKVLLYDHYVTGKPIEDVVNWLKDANPDVLGFSVLSANLPTGNAIAKEAKKWNPNLIVIYGGYLPTFCAPDILKHYQFVDLCVRGEGEHTVIELMDCLEKNKPLTDVLGITYRDNGKIVENPDRPLIQDLDTIPFPDRELLHQTYQFHGKITTIISSRGCPYSCSFCSCWKFGRGKWRRRSLENVIEEMLSLQAKGYQELLFTDDCFNAQAKRVLKLCYLMKKEKLDFDWHSIGRVTKSDVHLIRTMVEAGCKTMTFGIESANQRILDYYNKRASPEMAITAVRHAKKAGIENIGAGFLIGAPNETREEILNTIKFGFKLQKYGLSSVQHQILYISPGTTLHQEFVAKGRIDPETDWGREIPAIDIVPNSYNREYLEFLSKRSFLDFVTKKRFIISEFYKSARSLYRLRAVARLLQPRARNF